MSKLKIYLSIFAAVLILVSCKTTDTARQTTQTTQNPVVTSTNQQTEVFDPRRVTQAQYTTTKEEVQQFIDRLNQIIRTRNYTAWRDTLSQEYINEYSSAEKLKEISDEPLMKRQNIVLRNLNDYFTQVFVPSRNPDRIQINNVDIEFVTAAKVRAFIIRTSNTGENSREILYNLEKINNAWKIIN
ncbi:MAG: hypothetical protein FWC22_04170 [Treponema sp.]|nr:hypothetical protein [Treponema sp.]